MDLIPTAVCGPVWTLGQEGGVVYAGGERGLGVLHRLAQACHALAQGKVRSVGVRGPGAEATVCMQEAEVCMMVS